MRVIKFRAWDIERKAWMNEQDVYNEVREQGRWNPERGQFYKLMQFTGLYDKNGKEIYEGDILSFTGLGNMHDIPFLILWNTMTEYSDWSPKGKAEIIGNIYENPELINA